MMPRSRITWVIGGAVVAPIAVAAVDAVRSPDDEANASATTAATTAPFSPTTTVVRVIDDEAAKDNNFVMNQDPEDLLDESGNPLPACSQDQLQVSIPPVRDLEGDGFFATLLVRGSADCRQDYPYFRVVLRNSRCQQLLVWSGRLLYSPDPDPVDPTSAHFGSIPCQSWEVFPAFVTFGYDPLLAQLPAFFPRSSKLCRNGSTLMRRPRGRRGSSSALSTRSAPAAIDGSYAPTFTSCARCTTGAIPVARNAGATSAYVNSGDVSPTPESSAAHRSALRAALAWLTTGRPGGWSSLDRRVPTTGETSGPP
jgi:hypothetical protein